MRLRGVERSLVWGFAAMFVFLLTAMLLTTSYPVHRSLLIFSIGVVFALSLFPLGVLVDVSIRRSLYREWQEPDPGTWRLMGLGIPATAIALVSFISAVQPLFGKFPWSWSVLWIAIGGVLTVAWAFAAPRLLKVPPGPPFWTVRYFRCALREMRMYLAYVAADWGLTIRELPEQGARPAGIEIMLAEEEAALVWSRRKGGVKVYVRTGPQERQMRALVEAAAVAAQPQRI